MKATIGLEVHLALATKEKLFSRTSNEILKGVDNNGEELKVEDFSIFDCATPGVLPVLSKQPVEMAVAFGLAVGAEIRKESYFERKHYFYPDLPFGYQITQQNKPILWGGNVAIENKQIQIEHAHLECDAAKSIHNGDSTYIDLFRSASPLLEIVSTPCMNSAKEAVQYAKAVHELGMFLGICDGKIEEGSFRVDASISISDTEKLGTRVEIKNIASFNFLEKAINYEIERQHEVINSGGLVDMETRLFQESDYTTHSMRKKETVDEYRYLMDPDIPVLSISDRFIEDVSNKYQVNFFEIKRYLSEKLLSFGIQEKEIDFLKNRDMWLIFYKNKELQTEKIAKMIAYWVPEGKFFTYNQINSLSTLGARECKDVMERYIGIGDIKDLFPKNVNEDEVLEVVRAVVNEYSEQVNKYKNGDIKIFQFLMGQCMKRLKNKTTVDIIKELLLKNI